MQLFSMRVDWNVILCLIEVSHMLYKCTYCLLLCKADTIYWQVDAGLSMHLSQCLMKTASYFACIWYNNNRPCCEFRIIQHYNENKGGGAVWWQYLNNFFYLVICYYYISYHFVQEARNGWNLWLSFPSTVPRPPFSFFFFLEIFSKPLKRSVSP